MAGNEEREMAMLDNKKAGQVGKKKKESGNLSKTRVKEVHTQAASVADSKEEGGEGKGRLKEE
jgi:hypothetical protein